MRRSCALCGQSGNANDMKRMYSGPKNSSLIMVASLSLIGGVERTSVDSVVEQITKNSKCICHSHVIEAAQYICAEMAASGSRLSYCEDPNGGKSSPYVSTADIPSHLAETINGLSNGNVIITTRDIWTFINGALKKYHISCLWPEHSRQEQEMLDKAESNTGARKPTAPFVKVEVDSGEDPYPAVDPGSGKAPYIKVEPGSDADFNMTEEHEDGEATSILRAKVPEHAPDDDSMTKYGKPVVHRVGHTDPADLQRYYLVHGALLMTLFRFCPKCGHRVGRTQLRPVGTAAVVKFECENCNNRPHHPSVRRWESQERVVAHSKERKYKGNVVAAVSAITTGLKFEDLVRWAQQLKMAIFSKSFFYQVFEWTRPAIETVYRSQQRSGPDTENTHTKRMRIEDMLAGLDGEKTVSETGDEQRKPLNKKPKLAPNSPSQLLWRDLVLEEVLKGRLIEWEAKSQCGGTSPGRKEAAEENFEWEM